MEQIASILTLPSKLSLEKGDTVLISSDILRLFTIEYKHSRKKPDINQFIDMLIEQVGSEGTILFPTFNWGFCKGETFDWNKNIGQTGSLGNTSLKRTDFKRTQHPIYSFSVYGKYKDYLCELDFKDSFGPESVFAFLESAHAKQITIDVDLTHCFTFLHYVEEKSGIVAYRYIKDFTSSYIDKEQQLTNRTYSMFVRDLDLNVETNADELQEDLILSGDISRIHFNGVPILIIHDLNIVSQYILNDILNNRSRKICKYIGQ